MGWKPCYEDTIGTARRSEWGGGIYGSSLSILAYLENKARVGAIRRCGLRRGITWNFTSLSKTQEFLQTQF